MIEQTRAKRPSAARSLLAICAVCVTMVAAGASGGTVAADPYAPLRLYEGAWKVIPEDKSKPSQLVDECARAGRFFACQQTVNDKPGPLVIFIPESAGRYHTQVVLPNGTALGPPGTLTISGDHWVYLTKPDAKGIRYRTTNDFRGRDRIRFAVAQSRDGKRWTVTLSGVEERVQR
jgi:hypothetical protein